MRNEITSDLRKAKAAYFRDQLKKAKTTSAYWNVLSKATNPKVRKKIDPLRAHVSKYRPEVYKTGKSKILKKIHKVALGKLLT